MRLVLIRRPGTRGLVSGGRRRVVLAHTRPGKTWAETFEIGDVRELWDLDLDAVAAGKTPGLGEPLPGPVALVCTNAKRDTCCAVFGRPLAQSLLQRDPDGVWECSHLGGHRFAPTALVLPHGYVYGRLTAVDLDQALLDAADDRVNLSRVRGRSTWSALGQFAEMAVRRLVREDDVDALTVEEHSTMPGRAGDVTVSHRDNGRWLVKVGTVTRLQRRPESCGHAPTEVREMVACGIRRTG